MLVLAVSNNLLKGVYHTRLERDILVQEDAKAFGAVDIPVCELF